jgi:hypothetical protein
VVFEEAVHNNGRGSFSFTLCSWAVVSITLSSLSSVVLFSGAYVFLSSSFSIVVAGCIFFVLLGLCHPSVRSFRLLSVISFIVASGVSFVAFVGMYFPRSILFCRRLTVFGRNLFVIFDFARTILPYEFTFLLIHFKLTTNNPHFVSGCCARTFGGR